ncbi:DUF892 family protein [Salmonella enterica]|nr:DUF892 family protein [Salmonella enterica]
MNIKTVEDLFIHLLSDTYSAEKQLTKALPKLARAKALKLLKETLDEEKQTDLKLTDLAVSNVNKSAERKSK